MDVPTKRITTAVTHAEMIEQLGVARKNAGSDGPGRRAYLDAYAFLRALPAGVTPPAIKVSPVEVRLRWRRPTATVTVGFYDDDDGGSYRVERLRNWKLIDRDIASDFKPGEPPLKLVEIIAGYEN